jgi:hypothetical protein
MSVNASASPDVNGLRRLYRGDALAQRFFDYLAARSKNARETTVDRLLHVLSRDGQDVSRRDLIGLLQALQEQAAGEFIVGRRGQPSRFRWEVGMIGLAKAVRGEDGAAIEAIDETDVAAETNGDDSHGEERAAPGTIRHCYQLRPDTQVRLDLPANLTTKEAHRLAEFIKTLPFDETPPA